MAGWSGLAHFFLAIILDRDWNNLTLSPFGRIAADGIQLIALGMTIGFFLVHLMERSHSPTDVR